MCIFNVNQPFVVPIVVPIHIKHVHFSVSYQWVIYQKFDWRGHESPSGYGPLLNIVSDSEIF